MKNNLLSTTERRVLWLSKTYESNLHDKKICDNQPIHSTSGITLWQDIFFLERNPTNATVMMPTKKPKGKELSDDQKKIIVQFLHLEFW